ncbi:thioredoxin fold domain-containing protein [bacterium]|nr:thioredoxin fold domain-containing protein [bacterium]
MQPSSSSANLIGKRASFTIFKSLVTFVVGLCTAQGSIAASEKEIIENLTSVRPDLEFQVIGESPLTGFYEVQVEGGPLLYVSQDGRHFFDGNLYQVTSNQFVDVRELGLIKERRDLFASRRTDDMIIFKPAGQTKAIINVFTDVDCGYCRKLHSEVPQLNAMGIEVRYLAYPRAGLKSDAFDKIATAWCSDTPNQTLTEIKNGKNLATAVCADNPIADHYRLGGSLGVTGTPAIVLMDGTMIPGYRPAADFAELLGLNAIN